MNVQSILPPDLGERGRPRTGSRASRFVPPPDDHDPPRNGPARSPGPCASCGDAAAPAPPRIIEKLPDVVRFCVSCLERAVPHGSEDDTYDLGNVD